MPATHKIKTLIQMALKNTDFCLNRNKKSQMISTYEYISTNLTVEMRLKQASIDKPANIPMLVTHSHIPTQSLIKNQLRISKGKAVNALFMSKEWIYVKTFDEKEGFIPKKCLEAFNDMPKIDETLMKKDINHTYISIKDDIEFDDVQNSTNLSLFSISRVNLDISKSTTFKNNDIITNLKTTSRNRKVSLRKKVPSSMTLTMLENKQTNFNETYIKNQVRKNLVKKSLKTHSNNLVRKRVLRSISSQSSNSNSSDEYDLLMTCSSDLKRITQPIQQNYQLYQCIKDYQADFKGDLCIQKGDLVYVVRQTEEALGIEWLQVRKLNTKLNIIEEGFVPRDCVTRIYDIL